MGKEEEEAPPIILEGIGWKRRSGFGKYSGSAWERRRFCLTSTQLTYYSATEESKSATARGVLSILPERATITATYPGDSSQPTPYAVDIKVTDGITKSENFKWKLCFDDRETQLIWLVALTDIVADASVKEYNANVLAAENSMFKEHEGFHRLYEEGDGRLLDLVHESLMSSGSMRRKLSSSLKSSGDSAKSQRGIEVVQQSTKVDIRTDSLMSAMTADSAKSSTSTSPVSVSPPNDEKKDEEGDKTKILPMEKLYQALAVVVVSIVYEKYAKSSSSLLWQLANVIILYICFGDSIKQKSGDTKEGKDTTKQVKKTISFDPNSTKNDTSKSINKSSMTKSMVGAELMKAEGVPLSCMPSERFSTKPPDEALLERFPDDGRLHRPLTEDEMKAHKHERWAMAAPTTDISGEWTLIADDAFKTEYDTYLKQLGFNGITRKVACGLIARTTELTKQTDNGRELYLKGTNPKGAWERTLFSSGYPDFDTEAHHKEGEDYSHSKSSIKTADAEDVDAEAWWEEQGTKHRSWLRGGKKYGGGDFESLRYLEEGGSVLVCESFFHPKDPKKKTAAVTWRFQRD